MEYQSNTHMTCFCCNGLGKKFFRVSLVKKKRKYMLCNVCLGDGYLTNQEFIEESDYNGYFYEGVPYNKFVYVPSAEIENQLSNLNERVLSLARKVNVRYTSMYMLNFHNRAMISINSTKLSEMTQNERVDFFINHSKQKAKAYENAQ